MKLVKLQKHLHLNNKYLWNLLKYLQWKCNEVHRKKAFKSFMKCLLFFWNEII
jgi:hypothetical protein